MSNFSIVEFTNEFTADARTVIDVIPTSWITGPKRDECFWPTGRTVCITKAVKNKYLLEQTGQSRAYALYEIQVT